MAYMIGNEGPYPNLAGDWVCNVPREDADQYRQVFTVTAPNCQAQWCTADLIAKGMLGLYLKVAHRMPEGAVEFPTPPELTEPPE